MRSGRHQEQARAVALDRARRAPNELICRKWLICRALSQCRRERHPSGRHDNDNRSWLEGAASRNRRRNSEESSGQPWLRRKQPSFQVGAATIPPIQSTPSGGLQNEENMRPPRQRARLCGRRPAQHHGRSPEPRHPGLLDDDGHQHLDRRRQGCRQGTRSSTAERRNSRAHHRPFRRTRSRRSTRMGRCRWRSRTRRPSGAALLPASRRDGNRAGVPPC